MDANVHVQRRKKACYMRTDIGMDSATMGQKTVELILGC